MFYPEEVKQKAKELRRQGLSYTEIQEVIKCPVPKNTFTGWFKDITLSDEAKSRIRGLIRDGGAPGRAIAWENAKLRRENLVKTIYQSTLLEIPKSLDPITSKICLAMLYLGEGGKTGETFRFGNSDPKIIKLFLSLLRTSFAVDEFKLRGKVQCRADQKINV